MTAKGIVLAALAFGLMVIAHEFGHFLAAKLTGVRVEKFSVGFGWKLFGRQWGETEYMVCAVPLGGYVKMAGGDEGQEATGAPDEFVSKSPGQRAAVLFAGPLFSVLFGLPMAVIMLLAGREVPQAKVSHVVVESAAWQAGIKQGDKIIRVDGQDTESFDKLRQAVLESDPGVEIPVAVERDGREVVLTATREKQAGLGVQCNAVQMELKQVTPGSPAAEAGLKKGDVVLSAAGSPLREWQQFRARILESPDQPLTLRIRRDGEEKAVTARPKIIEKSDPGFTFRLPNEVGYVRAGFPAEGKLKVGDRITAVNGADATSWMAIENAVPLDADTATLTVARDGETKEVEVNLEAGIWLADRAGIAPPPVYVVEKVHGTAEPALKPGDRILEAGGAKLADAIRTELLYMPDVDVLNWLANRGTLQVQRGGDEPFEVTLKPETLAAGQLGIRPEPYTVTHQESLAGALAQAPQETLGAGLLVFTVLHKLITADADPKSTAGPLGIFQILYVSARRGWGYFFWLVHLLTVNIGVLNLLPIPPLDGGRLVMVGYEKVRGRRMSQRVQEAILIGGVAIILMIFAYATLNDVRRMFMF
jgi:regulator of sigma E protease